MEPPSSTNAKAGSPEEEPGTDTVTPRAEVSTTSEPQAKVIAAWLAFLAAILVPIIVHFLPPSRAPEPPQQYPTAQSENLNELATQIVSTSYRLALAETFATRGWGRTEFDRVLASISQCRAEVQKRHVAFRNSGPPAAAATLERLEGALLALEATLQKLQPLIGDVAALSSGSSFDLMERAEGLRLDVNKLFETFANQMNIALPPLPKRPGNS